MCESLEEFGETEEQGEEVEHYQLFHFDFERIKTEFSIVAWLLVLGIARICMSWKIIHLKLINCNGKKC